MPAPPCPTCPLEALRSEQPLISSRTSPASTTSSTSAWLSGSTSVTKTRPSTYLWVRPSHGSAPGTHPHPLIPFVPAAVVHGYVEAGKSHPADAEMMGERRTQDSPSLISGALRGLSLPFSGQFEYLGLQILLEEED